jgi:hypothetical protein
MNIDTLVKMIKPPEYNVELEIEKEKTRQEEAKSRQLELKIELIKLSNGIKLYITDDQEKTAKNQEEDTKETKEIATNQDDTDDTEDTATNPDDTDDTEETATNQDDTDDTEETATNQDDTDDTEATVNNQEELKKDINPLYKFLVEKCEYKKGNMVPISEIREEFQEWLGGGRVKQLDNGTFYQVNEEYKIKIVKLCKQCEKEAGDGCCKEYSSKERVSKKIVYNIKINIR